jgi:zinc protease
LDFAAWWLALGAALALAAAPARAAQPGMLPFAAEERALPNGLAVVVVPYESAGLVAVATIVRAGSRLEPAGGPSGLAHAVEHMAFRGGQRYDAAAYARLMQSLGAESAAETSDDWTG